MSPGKNRRLLAQMTRGIATHVLVLRQVRLLKIRAAAHQQELKIIFAAGPVKLRSTAKRRAKIVQLNRVWRIEKTSRGEPVGKGVVAESALCAAVLGVQVIVVLCGATKIHRSMVLHVAAGAGRNIQHAAKTVAILGSKAAGHQINCLKD